MPGSKRFIELIQSVGLVFISSAFGLLVVNAFFLIWIRSPYQEKLFPRAVVSLLPAPVRWQYPETGTRGVPASVALIGDSYVEGSGDAYFLSGEYSYSVGHYLHSKTEQSFAVFGSSGTFLPVSISFYLAAMKGALWPLFDGVSRQQYPERVLLFFYEGNDLDDYQSHLANGSHSVQQSLPLRWRLFPLRVFLHRVFSERWLNPRVFDGNEKRLVSSDRPNKVCNEKTCVFLPKFQSASPALSAAQIQEGLDITAKSLKALQLDYGQKDICLFYIPSPATVYDLDISHTYNVRTGEKIKLTRSSNLKRSLAIRSGLQERLASLGVKFFDLTKSFQLESKKELLHGRIDPDHFNLMGYQVLGDQILATGPECLPFNQKS